MLGFRIFFFVIRSAGRFVFTLVRISFSGNRESKEEMSRACRLIANATFVSIARLRLTIQLNCSVQHSSSFFSLFLCPLCILNFWVKFSTGFFFLFIENAFEFADNS